MSLLLRLQSWVTAGWSRSWHFRLAALLVCDATALLLMWMPMTFLSWLPAQILAVLFALAGCATALTWLATGDEAFSEDWS